MSTHIFTASVARLFLGAACLISSVSCGGELLRTGRAPVYLTIENMSAQAGGEGESAFLLSDVQVLVDVTLPNGQTVQQPTIFNDNAVATIGVNLKNPSITETALNSVTLTRYRVAFRRTDGRNAPGVDVPFGFDGGLGVTIPAGSSRDVAFELVRHQSKLEPPLMNLAGFGGLGFISTIAEVTFWGHDQNGNEVMVTGRIDVQFGDFGDDQ
jgi:hypothetical protein